MSDDLQLRAAALAELTARQRVRYREDPVAFAEERLGLRLTGDQKAVLLSVRDNPRTFVKAGNGVGKTFISSVVVAWTMECFEPALVVTSAPSFDQVKDLLWKEIRARFHEARPRLRGKLLDRNPRWNVNHEHFAVGRTAAKEEGFKGIHSSGQLLIVLDEGPGVPEYIYTATTTMLKGKKARLLTIGNPTTTSGSFFDAFNAKSKINSTLTMSPRTHPNVTEALECLGITWEQFVASDYGHYELPDDWEDPFPGAVSLMDIDIAKEEWGVGTPSWDSIIEGSFPTAGDRALVSLAWVDAARLGAADKPNNTMPGRLSIPDGKWAGLDIARFGDDRSVLVKMDGKKIVSIESWKGMELSFTAGRAAQAIMEGYIVNLDEGGLGAGITSHLTQAGFSNGRDFRANNAGGAADDPKRFMRMRDQLWCDTADFFRAGVIDLSELPEDQFRALKAELTAVELLDPGPRGQRRVESKKDTKQRLRRSPDIADAFNLALWRPRLSTPPIIVKHNKSSAIMAGSMTEIY